jgi:hypothetical protein
MDAEGIMWGPLFWGALVGAPLATAAGARFVRSPGGAALCAFLSPVFALPLWIVYTMAMNHWLCGQTVLGGYWTRHQPDPVCAPGHGFLVYGALFALVCATLVAPILVYMNKKASCMGADNRPTGSEE